MPRPRGPEDDRDIPLDVRAGRDWSRRIRPARRAMAVAGVLSVMVREEKALRYPLADEGRRLRRAG